MNSWSVLKASKGIPVDDFFDLLFAQSMGGGEQWKTYEGTLPATINANGDDMRQYQVYGATGGVGDRTENLCPNTTILSSVYNVSINTGELFNALKNIKPGISHWISWTYKSNGSGGVSNQIRLYTSESVLVKLINNDSAFSLTAEEITTFTKITAYFGANNTNGVMTKFMLTEGSTASYVPYGYKLDMGVKSENLWNEDYSGISTTIKYKPLFAGDGDFTLSTTAPLIDGQSALLFLLSGQVSSGASGYNNAWNGRSRTQTSVDGYVTIAYRIFGYNPKAYKTMLNAGSTALPYQPYSNTTTTIYIGDDPLGEDEYVDYQAQKIYRLIDGTLTPTDPPVPLPALPTCEGETVVDYAGQSVAPEKVVFKYK